MATKVPSELIADLAITGSKLHTALGNTGVTANSSGLHIGQDVATSATVQFQTVTGAHAGTIAAAATGTTQANTDNSAKMATTAFVTNKIQELIGGAPSTLNDLNELAAAINDDASYNSTLTTALALKATIASPTFAGNTRVNGDFSVSAASGEDRLVIAPQAAGSGTFVISYNAAANAYEPLTIDFETLALRSSGTPRISIAGNGDIDLGDTTVKADGQLLVNLTSSDVGAGTNAIEADGSFRFRNGNHGIKNNDGSYETWLARSLTGNKTIYGEKLTVDIGNSRVGINNSSPTFPIDLTTSERNMLRLNSTNGTARSYYLRNDNGMMVFGEGSPQDSSDKMVLDTANSRLGIGNKQPLATLDASGTLRSRHNIVSDTEYTFLTVGSDRSINDYGGLNKNYISLSLATPGTNTNGAAGAHAYGDLYFNMVDGGDTTFHPKMILTYTGDLILNGDGSKENLNVLNGSPKLQIGNGAGHSSLQFYSGATSVAALYFGKAATGVNRYNGYIEYRHDIGSSVQEMAFQVAGHNTLKIHNNKIGINCVPNAALEVARGTAGYAGIFGAPQGAGKVVLFKDNHASPNKYNWLIGTQYNTNNAFEITPSTVGGGYTFNNPAITILDSGKVGINNNAPNLQLEVTETADTWIGEFSRTGAGYGLRVDCSGASNDTRYAFGAYTPGGTGMFLRNNGSVGIGQNAPTQKLHVHSGASGISYSPDGADQLILENSDSMIMDIRTPNNNTGGILFSAPQGRGRGSLTYSQSTDTMHFVTAGAARFLINDVGNAHLGAADGDVRMTFGSTGTENTNSSNNIRASGSAFMYNSPSQHLWEINGTEMFQVDSNGVRAKGHVFPKTDNSYSLGTSSLRWSNIYTHDLHLSNEGSNGNDVDGSTGDWTIQEGETDLFIINNKSGKKYKFALEEIQ